ncbi:mitochondrial basic amino acids transporter isoform X2 [Cryptotermes secundus]|uniref:mitochondrial basic amino acids transporter isoform X2 n=1 Tax=Cryptotermes secundus TaxID=105785 RepID=UPI000CD7DD15|nr:mitochondrial basic amino acids transporter isoform X2 [Cryptotermes secundus]XP_033606388.1 mitochondrial basic amino acids transporter isoform X2 [Cryptotermes secundus]XP_033606389.1 mitochondrial basic amino acids transporter isoform X2 [Cryptotermes secundus]
MALDFIAGCLGGCAGVLVGHPFDTIKVRLQTQSFRNPQYKGAVDCFTKIIRKESVGGLYKGMSSPMAGVAMVNAVVFGVYGNFQRHSPQPDALSSHFLAGAAAGFVQSFVCSPMELVKTRLQVQQHSAVPGGGCGGPMNCLSQVVKTEGFRGVFRGLGTTICREVPGFGLYFVAYEFMTRSAGDLSEPRPPVGTLRMLLAGGFSGTLSWVLTYPIDVVKSRLQVDGMGGVYRYSGFMDCLKKSIQTEGYGVMTRGLTSTILRAFPTNAATFTVVTWVIRWTDAKQAENTSGYVIEELVDLTVPEMSMTQKRYKRSNDDARLEITVFGLWESLEYKEKDMNNIFQWRKRILQNIMGSNIFCSEQLMPKYNPVISSDKGQRSRDLFCDKIKEDPCLEFQLFQGNKSSRMDREEVQDGSEDQDGAISQKQTTDSNTEKEPNHYEHKNDYYNSSVR